MRKPSAKRPAAAAVAAAVPPAARPVTKKATGIVGFDRITGGGLPDGRCTAIIGGAGTGKSLFAMQNLLNRFRSDGEAGLFVTFEEPIDRVRSNLAALDWAFDTVPPGKLVLLDARLPVDTMQAGAFDLIGLLAGLSALRAETGARNVVFDGVDLLIGPLNDEHLERREIARIDEWIHAEGMSAVMTVKRYGASDRDQRRSDLIQYVSDCVVLVEAELFGSTLSRTLRVVKYRGSGFASNAVPMVIGPNGVEVIASEGTTVLDMAAAGRASTGILRLDGILDGGFVRGSSILVSGAPGTAKTSLASSLVAAACAAGERALLVSFDESDAQIVSNMRSIGLDLAQHVASGRLVMGSLRSSGYSPEECYLRIVDLVRRHRPDVLVVDPLSAFSGTDYPFANAISENLIDLAKSRGITFLGTSLLDQPDGEIETSASHVSTIADTWIHLSYVVQNGERNRALTIIKSRGTGHSNQVRELSLGAGGLDLVEVYAAEGKVLLGSARIAKVAAEKRQEEIDELDALRRQHDIDRQIGELAGRAVAAAAALDAKRKEAAFDEAAEAMRIDARQATLEQRLEMRRQADDEPPRPKRAGRKEVRR